jgi:hypothetical protein
MPSLTLKVNFTKGWPNPSIVEKVAAPASGVTTLDQGMVGHLDLATNTWVLGVDAITHTAYVFRNAQNDPDAGRLSNDQASYIQANLGGIQGISFENPIEFWTTQYSGTPAPGDQLYADTDGLLKVAINAANSTITASKPIVAVVTQGPKLYQGTSHITVIPDTSKRSS